MPESTASFIQLLKINDRAHYRTYTALFVLLSLIVFPLLFHILIIKYHEIFLKEYAEDNLTSAAQVSFQISLALEIKVDKDEAPCSVNDLENLRDFLGHYHYIGDIGRTANGVLICTANRGTLLSPEILPEPFLHTSNGRYYWNSQNKLRINDKYPPFFGKNNTVVYLSPLYMKDFELYSHTNIAHLGGMLYSSEINFVYKVFGDVSLDLINRAIEHSPSILDYLPIKNRFIKYSMCDTNSSICTVVTNRILGLYRLNSTSLMLIAIFSLIFGAVISFLYSRYQSGPRMFFRKLKKAIDKNKIRPEYQPQIRLSDKKIVGVESLARWHDPGMGFVSPDIFISSAEELGLIDKLTRNFITIVFSEMHEILETDENFSISINLSSDILIDENFLQFLDESIEPYSFNINQVVIEVTERISSDSDQMSAASRRLSNAGYLISLDDFGTGFSNLAWLSTLEPYEIKIDKMFTQSVDLNSINNITLQGIFKMIDFLKVKVVFEGIETKTQLDFIKERVPAAIGQGWYFYRSVKIKDLKKLIYQSSRSKQERRVLETSSQ